MRLRVTFLICIFPLTWAFGQSVPCDFTPGQALEWIFSEQPIRTNIQPNPNCDPCIAKQNALSKTIKAGPLRAQTRTCSKSYNPVTQAEINLINGVSAMLKGDLRKATRLFFEAKSVGQSNNLPSLERQADMHLAFLFQLNTASREALRFINNPVCSIDALDPATRVLYNYNKARYLVQTDYHGQAIRYLLTGLTIAQENQLRRLEKLVQAELALAYIEILELDLANKALKAQNQLKCSSIVYDSSYLHAAVLLAQNNNYEAGTILRNRGKVSSYLTSYFNQKILVELLTNSGQTRALLKEEKLLIQLEEKLGISDVQDEYQKAKQERLNKEFSERDKRIDAQNEQDKTSSFLTRNFALRHRGLAL